MKIDERTLIQVCDACLTASCFYGEHTCEDAYQAGTTARTVAECRASGFEHPEDLPDAKLELIYGPTRNGKLPLPLVPLDTTGYAHPEEKPLWRKEEGLC